jgi:hypothetical protein
LTHPSKQFLLLLLKTQLTLTERKKCGALKVPECEIFVLLFFAPAKPIWIGDLGAGQKTFFVNI